MQGDGCARKYQRKKESACARGLLHKQGEGEGVAGCNSETSRVMLSEDPGTFLCCVGGREFGQG